MNSYFIQLPDGNATINLAHVTDIEWLIEPNEKINPAYTSKVNLTSGSHYYLTSQDAKKLWATIQKFNNNQLKIRDALIEISSFLSPTQGNYTSSYSNLEFDNLTKENSEKPAEKYTPSVSRK